MVSGILEEDIIGTDEENDQPSMYEPIKSDRPKK